MTETVTIAAEDARAVSYALTLAAMTCGVTLAQVPGFHAALEANTRLSAALAGSAMPEDPVSGPQEGAIGLHESMRHYENAGFEHSEAFMLVLTQVQAAATGHALRGENG